MALDLKDESERSKRITNWLAREVWPTTVGKKPLTKEQEEALLGYGELAHQ